MKSLTVPEVAERLHVHADVVRDLIRSGELQAFSVNVRPGSSKPRYRITSDALEQFITRRSIRTPTRPTRRPRKQRREVRQWV